MPWASTICPRVRGVPDEGPMLVMRLPSMTTVVARRSVPFETSTTVAFAIVSLCADSDAVANNA